jgi:predicted NAD/FAD-binding protein
MEPLNIAVVGSGIGGLSAAWILAEAGHNITLFEAEDRIGGHALTVDSYEGGPRVDLGFQV